MNALLELRNQGQSIWLDYISRGLIASGGLGSMIENDGLRGVTSNPSIFEKAIDTGTDYDARFRELVARNSQVGAKEIYDELVIEDGDDLVEKVGGLLIQGQVSEFVTDEQRRLGVDLQPPDERVIHLRRQQMIEHVHGGGEQHALIRLAGLPGDDLGQKGFAHAWIADEDCAGSLLEEVEVQQSQDAGL